MIAVLLVAAVMFPQTSKVEAAGPSIDLKAGSAIMVDADTGKILYEKNADAPASPASMTKMMAEYLILDAIKEGKMSWDSKVHINDYIYKLSQNDSLSGVPLRKDVTYTVEELYKAMAVYSANGATVALGNKIYGNEKKFVDAMNKKAKQLGMNNTKFVNSTGLNNGDLYGHQPAGGSHEENMMSARSTAKLAYYLLKDHPEVLKYTSIEHAKFTKGEDKPIKMDNWNWMLPGLIYGYKGVDGLKTGHTDKAGYCFTATAKRGGTRLISVVMKTASEAARFKQTKILLDYGFEHFEKTTLLDRGYVPKDKKQLPVTKGKTDSVGIETAKPIQMVIEKGTKKEYKPKLTIDGSLLTKDGKLTAPVKKGKQVGTVKMVYTGNDNSYGFLTKNDNTQAVTPVVTTKNAEKASWFTLTLRSIGGFFSSVWSGAVNTVKGWL